MTETLKILTLESEKTDAISEAKRLIKIIKNFSFVMLTIVFIELNIASKFLQGNRFGKSKNHPEKCICTFLYVNTAKIKAKDSNGQWAWFDRSTEKCFPWKEVVYLCI